MLLRKTKQKWNRHNQIVSSLRSSLGKISKIREKSRKIIGKKHLGKQNKIGRMLGEILLFQSLCIGSRETTSTIINSFNPWKHWIGSNHVIIICNLLCWFPQEVNGESGRKVASCHLLKDFPSPLCMAVGVTPVVVWKSSDHADPPLFSPMQHWISLMHTEGRATSSGGWKKEAWIFKVPNKVPLCT